jgi:Arabinose efflux permease
MERTPLLNESDRVTSRHLVILGMAWAGWLFDFYDLMLLSFLLVPIKRDLALSNWKLSFLLGTTLAATALGGIVFGGLADRFGRKRVLSWTMLTYSVGTFLCGFSGAFWPFLMFRVLTGLGVGGEWATGQTLIGETFPARVRARFAAIMQTGAPLGILLASLVGSFAEPAFVSAFGESWGWRSCFFVSVLPALLVVVIRRHMPESDVWESQHQRESTSAVGLLSELKVDRVLRRLFFLGLVLALADMSAYWFTYTWMPKYLYDQLGFSLARSGMWMVVTQLAGLTGYLSYGVVADWKGRRWAYSVFSLIWALGLLGITWFWGAIGALPWLPLLFMILVGFGTGNFSGYGPIFSELFPTRIRSSAMGAAFNLSRGAQFFTPLVITWIATMPIARQHGLGAGISLGAFFAVFTGLWVWMLPETKGTQITE